jgi:hypothetical protein
VTPKSVGGNSKTEAEIEEVVNPKRAYGRFHPSVIREQRGNWHADFLGVFNHTALSAFQAGLAVVSSRTMAHCARIKVGTSITATPPLSAHPQIPELADQSPLRDSAGVNRPRENSAGRVQQYLPREGLEQAPSRQFD